MRPVKPRAYGTPNQPDRDPEGVYKEYARRKPDGMRGPDTGFFLYVNMKYPKPGQLWFKCQNMGINKIYSIMKTMKANANICHKRLINHSARKHLIQKLNDNNIPPNQIIQISGHKNLCSVNNYSKLNATEQESISSIMSNTTDTHSHMLHTMMPQSNQQFQDNTTPMTSEIAAHQVETHIHLCTEYSQAGTKAIFQGSTFNNCVINIYSQPSSTTSSPPPKFRRILSLPNCEDSD